MIKKILIANRGEIAARIIRSCKKLGIQTVAVFSEADQSAPYVAMADEAFLLGAPPVKESYMNSDKIIAIARKCHVDAIHPGYGFLSENGDFARKCEDEGFLFIGPKSEIIDQMGNKIAARNAMKNAGIPIVPGCESAVHSIEEARNIAHSIGYPVMLKASAGGGGIGMQVISTDEELLIAFESNSKRAKMFFGDGSMFIEKKIDNARHIEIQILADHFGNVVHLFERECSIQRRNQKVVEEAPSSFISETTRSEMGAAAIKAAKAINYTNAGTIEFLVDENENFYFLEMNTRIQVEHPITEEITGVDIVDAQISITNGVKLNMDQNQINRDGHAIEVRIYAEDPHTFFPSPGKITRFDIPQGKNIRNETTVTNHYQVTPFYDPMIGKLIVKGKSRLEAIENLREALLEYKIEGIKTNIPLLLKIVENDNFKKGLITTSFIQDQML